MQGFEKIFGADEGGVNGTLSFFINGVRYDGARGLDGRVSLRIPACTNNGQQLRVRGRGLPKGRDNDHGDLYVIVNVQLPKEISDEERTAWEKLSQVSHFNPRKLT